MLLTVIIALQFMTFMLLLCSQKNRLFTFVFLYDWPKFSVLCSQLKVDNKKQLIHTIRTIVIAGSIIFMR